jgi:fermentation-respiration switch protein FrsA (DUF1100 family)
MSVAPSGRRSFLVSLLTLRGNPRGKSWWYATLRLGVGGLYLYAALVVLLVALEDRLLYRPVAAAAHWNPPPRGLEPRDVEFTDADGARLHGWWCPPPDWAPQQGALLLCHGNSGNVSYLGPAALQWRDQLGVAVFLFDYPGYGRSGGRPTEANCYVAADAAYDWLVQTQHVPPERLILHGQSLGGGVAVDLAARRPHRALILTSTFTSFPDVAQATVPVVPGCWLAHNQYRSGDKITHVTTPVFVAHGTADHVVPYRLGERLFAAIPSQHKRFLGVEGAHHNLLGRPDVQRAAHEFLDGLDAAD